jgi:histidinol-phosphate aminotransferase
LAFISSPWNPVGVALDRARLDELVAATPANTVLVLDEAYVEYARLDGMADGIEALREAPISSIVLRTFSKAYGLAGLRAGYAVCSDPAIAGIIARAKTPFNVNAAAQLAARIALADAGWMIASATRMRIERERVASALREMGFDPARSQANFLFFDFGRDSGVLAEALLRCGIIVKPWREAGFTNFLRVTIGRPAENDRFLSALNRMNGMSEPQTPRAPQSSVAAGS